MVFRDMTKPNFWYSLIWDFSAKGLGDPGYIIARCDDAAQAWAACATLVLSEHCQFIVRGDARERQLRILFCNPGRWRQ